MNYADGGGGIEAMLKAGQAWEDPRNREDGSFDRLEDIRIPVFIGQVHNDFMIPTPKSFAMQQKIPNARLKIFPNRQHELILVSVCGGVCGRCSEVSRLRVSGRFGRGN